MVGIDDPALHTVETYRQLKNRFAGFGLQIYRIANHGVHNVPEITLNLPGTGRQGRGADPLHRQPRGSRHPLSHLRPHGQRHLEHRPDHPPRRHDRPHHRRRRRRRPLEGPDLFGGADPRPPLFRRRAVGQLRLPDPQARPRGRRGRGFLSASTRTTRRSTLSAASPAACSAASPGTGGPSTWPAAPTSASVSASGAGSRGASREWAAASKRRSSISAAATSCSRSTSATSPTRCPSSASRP